MSSAKSEDELLALLRDLVSDNAETVFGPGEAGRGLDRLHLTGPRHRNQHRYHRELVVRHPRAGERRIWLKFLELDPSLYEIHTAVWRQTRDVCDLFPRPYFYVEWNGSGVIGMERVEGARLRSRFLRRMLTRTGGKLSAIFASLGEALRAFHDSSVPCGAKSVAELEERIHRLATDTAHLADGERERLLDRIATAARAAGTATSLPSIPIHHDVTLRNVVIRDGGSPCLLDLDSMRAPWKSRWYDVAVFLLNLESQIKYAPLGDAGSVEAAWRSFWSSYAGGALPDGLSAEQARALLFLIKVECVFGGTWLPVFEIYRGRLDSRYLTRLKASVLEGECLILAGNAARAA